MKSLRKELWFLIPARRGFVNITDQVNECVRESGVREGLVLVNSMHITASVFINDDEGGLHHDYEEWLEKLAPHEPVSGYWHNRTGEDNADAHMKRQVMGREVVVAITNGRLDFGPWEQIFYGEFDGGRKKRVLVNILAPVLIHLFEGGMADLISPGGDIVLAGILEEQGASVRASAEKHGLTYIEDRQMGDWVAFVMRKSSD